MKIGFICDGDAEDFVAWSGTIYSIRKLLENSGNEILDIDRIEPAGILIYLVRVFFYILSKLFGVRFMVNRMRFYHVAKARLIEGHSNFEKVDVYFSTSTIGMSILATQKPIYVWLDATFASILNFYPEFKRVAKISENSGNRLELEALNSIERIIVSSTWAKKGCIENYDVNDDKILEIPFGSNLPPPKKFGISEIKSFVETRFRTSICNILFVGVDWHRKGGDIVFDALNQLSKFGVNVHLHVVGCNPDITRIKNFQVTLYGFLNRSKPSDYEVLVGLFSNCHFLFVPSIAECYGIVFAEASSFGLPSLTRDVGGISSVVKHGVNGWALEANSSAFEYASVLREYFFDREKYESISVGAFDYYSQRLSWDRSVDLVVDAITSRNS